MKSTSGPWAIDFSKKHYATPVIRHNGQVICYFHEHTEYPDDEEQGQMHS